MIFLYLALGVASLTLLVCGTLKLVRHDAQIKAA